MRVGQWMTQTPVTATPEMSLIEAALLLRSHRMSHLLEALQSVHAALRPLAAEERTRVLASVYALLSIRGPDLTPAIRER